MCIRDSIWEHTSIIHTKSHIMVLGLGLGHVLFFGVWPCTFIWQHTSIIHTNSHILVLGLGLGHMLLLWWLTMYPHMKAYIHHPYSIMHIGIGPWLGSYVFFCWRTMYWHISIIHTQSRILYYIYILGLGLGHVMFLWRDVYIIYMYIYIPNTQYQKEKYHIKRSRFC